MKQLVEAAKRGGMKSIGYYNGHNSIEEIFKADLIIGNFNKVSYKIILNLQKNIVYDYCNS